MSLTEQRRQQKRIRRILEQNGIAYDGTKYLAIPPDITSMHKKKNAIKSTSQPVDAFGFQGVEPGFQQLFKKVKKLYWKPFSYHQAILSVSIKTQFVFQFNEEFLNEHKQLINADEGAIKCYTCQHYFKRGDWIFSSPTLKRKMKRRHLACALRINLAPKKYSKYLNAFYILGFGLWVMEIGRHFLLI